MSMIRILIYMIKTMNLRGENGWSTAYDGRSICKAIYVLEVEFGELNVVLLDICSFKKIKKKMFFFLII